MLEIIAEFIKYDSIHYSQYIDYSLYEFIEIYDQDFHVMGDIRIVKSSIVCTNIYDHSKTKCLDLNDPNLFEDLQLFLNKLC